MKILFVCTGNTCRSPMAAALARARGVDAASAGLFALDGDGPTPQAVAAAARLGGNLQDHRARRLTEAMLRDAERVYVMTPSHQAALLSRYPAYHEKVRVLEPAIPDPFGGDEAVYDACAQALLLALARAGIIPSAR